MNAHSIALSVLPLAFPPTQDAAGGDTLTLESLRSMAARIQAQIEDLRGLEFESEVRVELANAEEFLEYATQQLDARGGRERMRREERIAKLLGLLPGDADLESITLAVLAEQVGGFYDPHTDAFFIMDSVDPVLAEVVIAHEFTHALDDQHHDLDGGMEELQDDSDALLAHHAVIEGSGMEIMTQWASKHLSIQNMMRMAEAQAEMPTEEISKAPPYVWKPLLGIYLQGQAFLRRSPRLAMLDSARAEDIEHAFLNLPLSTEQVLHPDKYWKESERDDPRRVTVRTDAVAAPWRVATSDTFGELQTALLTTPFEERGGMEADPMALLGLRFTNAAAEGWDGDRLVLLEREGGGHALGLAMVLDSEADAVELAQALRALAPGIEEHKRLAGEPDPGTSGFLVDQRGDQVHVRSFWGVPADEAQRVLSSLVFEVE